MRPFATTLACSRALGDASRAAHAQASLNFNDADPNWDMLNAPFAACVSYARDLAPMSYGDKVRGRAPDQAPP
jgi:hypothetical protein